MRQLGPTDLFDLQYVRDARCSPDGRHIAYVTSRTDDEEHFEIWLARTDGNQPPDSHQRPDGNQPPDGNQLPVGNQPQRLAYTGNASSPRWSPDGLWLAFVGDERLRIATFPTLQISEPLTPQDLTVQGAPSWTPDATNLAVSLLERRPWVGPRRVTRNSYRSDGVGYIEEVRQRIYEVNRSSGALRCLTPDERMCFQPEWSPCGGKVGCLATDDSSAYVSFPARLLVIDAPSGAISELIRGNWFIACARWLPGGERMVVVGAPHAELTIPAFSVWVVENSERPVPQLRTPGLVGNIGFFVEHDMPVMELMYGSNSIVALDSTTALATVQRGGSAEIWSIRLEGEIQMRRILTGERSCLLLDAHLTANLVLFAATDLRSPTELWRATLDSHEEKALTNLNGAVLHDWPQTTVERFTFESVDGLEIETWFLAPRDRQGPLPTVLYIHGGPFGATGQGFRYDFHMLIAQGYGVLFANFRGSTGYGEPFTRAIQGNWGARGYPDHVGAVDAAIAKGLADPQRLGVWGHSHGGFATCWIVGHTSRFKAAIAEAGFANFATLYYLSDIPEIFVKDLGGRPHEIPDVYRSCSPITYAHRCTTPTMLLHGEDDLRCPISEAEQFFRALQNVGCPTELYRIPGCSHSGDSIGPLSARKAQNEALLSWFGKYL